MLKQVVEAGEPRSPAHRPSRRHLITEAATRVFAREGFSGATIQDVADEAKVGPTAVYYHFSGKDELFEVALRRAMDSCDQAVAEARPDDVSAGVEDLSRVMESVWDWTTTHAAEAALLSGLLTATTQSRLMQEEWEERHVHRGFAYLPAADEAADGMEHMRRALAVRTLIRLSISIHVLRMPGGPLSRHSPHALRKAVRDVSKRIVEL